jgi:hypothetical protein
LEEIGISKNFLSRTPPAQQLREKMNRWDYMKLECFCTTKEIVFKLKTPLTDWEKILVGYTSDKGLITRIHRELKKLSFPQINEPIKKWATELNTSFQRKKSKWLKNT